MQLSISSTCLAILATLLAAVQGAPAALNTTAATFTTSAASNSVNDCGDSSFINQSSPASPLVSDCQQIAYNIRGGGTWTVGLGGYHTQLASYGTCAFGAQGAGSQANFAYIGNQDIIDLINSSIQLFQWFDKVGSKGTMNCQGGNGYLGGGSVLWGIYHT